MSLLPFTADAAQHYHGRDNSDEIWRAKPPKEWHEHIPAADADTTKPIAEYFIRDNDGTIRITVHSFPSKSLIDRVAPLAQLKRWERQFSELYSLCCETKKVSHGGYVGYQAHLEGLVDGTAAAMEAWALQLSPDHYLQLKMAYGTKDADVALSNQLCSDITIKAVGPQRLIAKYKSTIELFANSFELIIDIPSS